MNSFKITPILLGIMVLLLSHVAIAQSVKRIEIESDEYESTPHIVTVGEKGVLVFNKSSEKVKGSPQEYWAFSLYNKDLTKSWSKKIPIYKGLTMEKYETDDEHLYLLFSEEDAKPQMHLVKVNISTGAFDDILQRGEQNVKYTDVEILDDQVFFSGFSFPTTGKIAAKLYLTMCCCFLPLAIPGYMVPKYDPILYKANFEQHNLKQIPIVYGRYTAINSLCKDDDKLYALIRSTEKNSVATTYLEEYDRFGKKLNAKVVRYDANFPLIDGHVSIVDDKTVMIGVFEKASNGTQSSKAAYAKGGFAEGLYFTSFSGGKQTDVKYYEFRDFNTFWSYIESRYGEKKAEQIKRKISKREARGKDVSIGYRLLVHDIIRKKDELIMVAEAYYPEYHTETRTSTGANGQVTTQTVQVFDGYRYTHAIVAGFDFEGNKVWDHSFEIGNILDFNLRERVRVMFKDDDIIMAYSSNGFITSKVLHEQKIIKGEKSVPIETKDDADMVKRNYQSNIEYWYDNFFLSSGVQRIKNKEKKGAERKRTVFYFNKVKFD